MTEVFIILVIVLVSFIFYAYLVARRFNTPTIGAQIDIKKRTKTALLIIDVQEDFVSPHKNNDWDVDYLRNRISMMNELARTAGPSKWLTLTVRQVHQNWCLNLLNKLLSHNRGCKDSDGLGLDKSLSITPDHDFTKPLSDAFSSAPLEKTLDDNKIGHLMICGLDGNYCVKNTIRGAMNRGYGVTFLDAAILAQSRKDWEAEKKLLIKLGARQS